MYVLRTEFHCLRGLPVVATLLLMAEACMAEPWLGSADACWKRVQLEMKELFKVGDSLEAIILGLGNDYLSQTTSVWNILWTRSWPALLGNPLEFAELERPQWVWNDDRNWRTQLKVRAQNPHHRWWEEREKKLKGASDICLHKSVLVHPSSPSFILNKQLQKGWSSHFFAD